MRTHTCPHQLATPVPDSTPPEHRPNTEDRLDDWKHLGALTGANDSGPRVNGE